MRGTTPLLFGLLSMVGIVLASEPCGKPADVAFVIDSSSSIWTYHFQDQIKFVQELVKNFDIGPETTQVAALTFSDKVGREFYFKDFDTADDVLEKVGSIVQANGKSTFTHEALEVMRTEFFTSSSGARDNTPKICILLTDGQSTVPSLTQEEAKKAKEAGIKILAIGIGDGVNDEELEAVVSPPAEDNYFHKASFSELKSVAFQQLIGQKACEVIETTVAPTTTTTTATITTEATTTTTTTTTTTAPKTTTTTMEPSTTTEMQKERPEKTCQGREADVVFIVDMSSSIWVEDFKKQLVFLSHLVDVFDIDSGKTRVGMVMFSDEARTQFYLDQYKSKADVSKAILEVTSDGGITNTHLALQKLLDEMLTPEHGSRPYPVAHICILITDGRSSKPELTLPQAEHVHSSGVYVFAIGVGNMTDTTELMQMASKPEFAFEVNGFKALPRLEKILANKACEVPQGDQPQCAKDVQADIMFGLYGIGGGDRDRVTEFVKMVGGGFNLSSENVRIGLQENCGRAQLELSEFYDGEHYSNAVSNAMETDLSSLLYNIRLAFGSSRDNAERIVILILSGEVQDMDKAYVEAMRLKYKARIIVVGVGKGVDREQMKRLGSYKNRLEPDISHVFPVDMSADLAYIVKKLHVLMCLEQ